MRRCGMSGNASVMGADETIAKVRGKAKIVGSVADAESGELLGIAILVDMDSDGFADWLRVYERLDDCAKPKCGYPQPILNSPTIRGRLSDWKTIRSILFAHRISLD